MADAIETSELLAFTRTVEAKSLSRAAAELGAPRATIGRRLARLEQRLGVRLLRRTTRALALTDAGDAFYRHALIVIVAVVGFAARRVRRRAARQHRARARARGADRGAHLRGRRRSPRISRGKRHPKKGAGFAHSPVPAG